MAIDTTDARPVELKRAAPALSVQLFAFIEILLLGVWIGSMIFAGMAVPPTAFGVLPTRHLAGQVVASSLMKVEILGLISGAVILLIQVLTWRTRVVARTIRVALTCIMLTAVALSLFWVSARMQTLRQNMGGIIDDVPPGDPLRVQFNELHQYSVAVMLVAMLAGITLLFLTVRSWLKR